MNMKYKINDTLSIKMNCHSGKDRDESACLTHCSDQLGKSK